MTLSLDGVQASKSSSASLDIYCINFKSCRSVYPIKLIKPNDKFKYEEQEELANVVNDLNESPLVIDTGVFDNPKRSFVKNTKCSSATYPCEYCESPAVNYIDNTMTKSQLTWPPSTMNGRPRTITAIRRIVNSIEQGDEDLTKHYLKGIKGRSVFLDQPNFDIIHDNPTEYMHIVCLGVVKRMVELTYKLGKNRPRTTSRKRTDPKLFNDIIATVKVTREFPRRCRNLDTAVYKALEYRNLILLFFPIVIENIEKKYKKERQLWLCLAFVIKACVIPNEEFDNVCRAKIINACELYYNLYFEVFGQRNCPYSIHVVSSHLLKMRGNVPLTERSAFKFESFYSEMKNLFKAGTTSPLKQILKNSFMKRALEYHTCQKTIFYDVEKKNETMENNSLIYTYKNKKHEMYVIHTIINDEFICKRQGKFDYSSTLLPNYEWKTVGVYKQGPIGDEDFRIQRREVQGKVVNVMNMLITCPYNVLNEK